MTFADQAREAALVQRTVDLQQIADRQRDTLQAEIVRLNGLVRDLESKNAYLQVRLRRAYAPEGDNGG